MSKSADAFRTISEVAEWLDTPAHVLRFWESKFTQVKPVKRAGGRRYYRPQDMMLLGGIKKLLHDDGMTIKHVQKLLRQEGVKHVAAMSSHPSDGLSYTAVMEEPTPQPQAETPSVVSFRPDMSAGKAAPEAPTTSQAAQEPALEPPTESLSEPDSQEASETIEPDKSGTEGALPFPSFLSGGRDMPAAEPAPLPEAEPEPVPGITNTADTTQDRSDAAEDGPDMDADMAVDVEEDPVPQIDILSRLAGRSVADLRAREAELRPIMDKLRAQLARSS